MKILKRAFLFLLLVLFFSCEKWGPLLINCTDCVTYEPEEAKLEINLSDNVYASTIEVKIYEGNLEDSVLYDKFQTQSSKANRWVLINKKYTLTARYYRPGYSYIVVNAVTPQVRYSEDQCEDPCYNIYNYKVDLRLKY